MVCIRIKNKKEIKELSEKMNKYGFEFRSKLFGMDPTFLGKYNGYLVIGKVFHVDNEKTLSYGPLDWLSDELKNTIMPIEELDEWLTKKNK